jgi:hypothetical protein
LNCSFSIPFYGALVFSTCLLWAARIRKNIRAVPVIKLIK